MYFGNYWYGVWVMIIFSVCSEIVEFTPKFYSNELNEWRIWDNESNYKMCSLTSRQLNIGNLKHQTFIAVKIVIEIEMLHIMNHRYFFFQTKSGVKHTKVYSLERKQQRIHSVWHSLLFSHQNQTKNTFLFSLFSLQPLLLAFDWWNSTMNLLKRVLASQSQSENCEIFNFFE